MFVFFFWQTHKTTLESVPQAIHWSPTQRKQSCSAWVEYLLLLLLKLWSCSGLGLLFPLSRSLQKGNYPELSWEAESIFHFSSTPLSHGQGHDLCRLLAASNNPFHSNIHRTVTGSQCHREFQFKAKSLNFSNFNIFPAFRVCGFFAPFHSLLHSGKSQWRNSYW